MKRVSWSIFWLAVVAAGLLALGGLRARERYLTRGMPDGLPEPIAHGGVQPGVNVRLEQYDAAALEATLSAIDLTPSIKAVKQPFFFSTEYDWQLSDQIVAAVAEHDLMLVPLLDGNPDDRFARPDIADFSDWAAEFARRYGEQVDYYFIWDEPNLSDHWGGEKVNPDAYAALLSASAAAIRASDATAYIIAAPLAPTIETDSLNMADWLYLQRLYEAAPDFDIVASKPYGFDTSPEDRRVDNALLNFSRTILLREIMVRNGDGGKAIWAGNWGWNALPDGWSGRESLWGDVSGDEQMAYTLAGLDRAQTEWPWMGMMFLENWEPLAEADDPRWGFSVAGSPTASVRVADDAAYPGFYFSAETLPHTQWHGDWEFSPEFGADSSEKYVENGDVRDSVTFDFYGTEIGLRVRRADFRSRFYVTVDGQPANARPRDEHGSTVVLDAPNPNEDYITTELVATGLEPGKHTLEVVAHRGWDQFALNGFSVGYRPKITPTPAIWGLWAVVALGVVFSLRNIAGIGLVGWRAWWLDVMEKFGRISNRIQLLIVSLVAGALSISGLLTWTQSTVGVYRRLGDVQQLALVGAAATIFYITPWFVVYLIALIGLVLLISLRPAWGIALTAFSIPLYARQQLLKPLFGSYQFSATELFTWATVAGVVIWWVFGHVAQAPSPQPSPERRGSDWPAKLVHSLDFAIVSLLLVSFISLFFTERLDVATNEFRTVILGASVFYALLRVVPMSRDEWSVVLDFFVLSGVVVAVFGLAQVVFGFQDLITSEGGLMRVQSIYGSPNNVALYFGRILPLTAAVTVFGKWGSTRHKLYALATAIMGLTFLLTISKGGLLIGAPFAVFVLFAFWLKQHNHRVLPWLAAYIALIVVSFFALLQIPQLAARLDVLGQTSFVRYRLWQASLSMVRENPWFGVGLDNFLYAHRGRYILESAWREPDLNHPHNFIFDFATRIGLIGLAIWLWLIISFGTLLKRLNAARPFDPLVIGLIASLGYILAHGLVDHSFFLIDLAYAFMLLLGLAISLLKSQQ